MVSVCQNNLKAFRTQSRVRNRGIERNVQALEMNNVYKSKIHNSERSDFARTFVVPIKLVELHFLRIETTKRCPLDLVKIEESFNIKMLLYIPVPHCSHVSPLQLQYIHPLQ